MNGQILKHSTFGATGGGFGALEALERRRRRCMSHLEKNIFYSNFFFFFALLCSAFPGKNIVFGKGKVLPCAKPYILCERISKDEIYSSKVCGDSKTECKGENREEFCISSRVSASQQSLSGQTQQDSMHLRVEGFSLGNGIFNLTPRTFRQPR